MRKEDGLKVLNCQSKEDEKAGSSGPLAGFGLDEEDATEFTSSFCFFVTLTCISCCARRLQPLVVLDAVISASHVLFTTPRKMHCIYNILPVTIVSFTSIASRKREWC